MTEIHKDIFFKGLYWLEENEYTSLIQFDECLENLSLNEAQDIIAKHIKAKGAEIHQDYMDDEYTIRERDYKIDVLKLYLNWNANNRFIKTYQGKLENVLFEAFKNKIKYDVSIDEAIDKEFDKIMIDFVKSVTNKIYR